MTDSPPPLEPARQRSDLLFLLQHKPQVIHPFDYVMDDMFPDESISSWCDARGIEFYLIEQLVQGNIQRYLAFQYKGDFIPNSDL